MRRLLAIISACLIGCCTIWAQTQSSTRVERKAILEGNKAYNSKNYSGALALYRKALASNPQSAVGRFNYALARMRMADALDAAKKKEKEQMTQEAREYFEQVAQTAAANPSLASRAFFNLGNMSYLAKDYESAVQQYKDALRLNPADDKARKNLRLAQLKLKQQNKDDKKDKKKTRTKTRTKIKIKIRRTRRSNSPSRINRIRTKRPGQKESAATAATTAEVAGHEPAGCRPYS